MQALIKDVSSPALLPLLPTYNWPVTANVLRNVFVMDKFTNKSFIIQALTAELFCKEAVTAFTMSLINMHAFIAETLHDNTSMRHWLL